MATFRKYEFDVYANFRSIHDIEAAPHFCVELGHINPDNSKAYCVDILWDSDEPEHWKQYQVWPPPVGVHTFLGWDEQYGKDYTERDDVSNTLNED